MKRAFTLIELLMIVAIMGTMVTVGVVSYTSSRASTSLFAAARDVMAVVRRARSNALVTEKPVVIKYSNEKVDDEAVARIEIISQRLFTSSGYDGDVYNLAGEIVNMDGDDDAKGRTKKKAESKATAAKAAAKKVAATQTGEAGATESEEESGETLEEILSPTKVDADVVKGLKIKVLTEDETLTLPENETRRSKISIFSTADNISRTYNASETSKEEKKASDDAAAEEATEEPVQIVFAANGTVDHPHKIWIYPETSSPEKGLCISVDRFGEPVCEDIKEL